MQNNNYPQKGILRTMQSDYAIATGRAKDGSRLFPIAYKYYKPEGKNQKADYAKDGKKSSNLFFNNKNTAEKPQAKNAKPSNSPGPTIVIQRSDQVDKLKSSTQNINSVNINKIKAEKPASFSGVVERSRSVDNPTIIINKPFSTSSNKKVPEKLPIAKNTPHVFSSTNIGLGGSSLNEKGKIDQGVKTTTPKNIDKDVVAPKTPSRSNVLGEQKQDVKTKIEFKAPSTNTDKNKDSKKIIDKLVNKIKIPTPPISSAPKVGQKPFSTPPAPKVEDKKVEQKPTIATPTPKVEDKTRLEQKPRILPKTEKLPVENEEKKNIPPKRTEIQEKIKVNLSEKELDALLPISSSGNRVKEQVKPNSNTPLSFGAQNNKEKINIDKKPIPNRNSLPRPKINPPISAVSKPVKSDFPKEEVLNIEKIMKNQSVKDLDLGHFDVDIKALPNQNRNDKEKDFLLKVTPLEPPASAIPSRDIPKPKEDFIQQNKVSLPQIRDVQRNIQKQSDSVITPQVQPQIQNNPSPIPQAPQQSVPVASSQNMQQQASTPPIEKKPTTPLQYAQVQQQKRVMDDIKAPPFFQDTQAQPKPQAQQVNQQAPPNLPTKGAEMFSPQPSSVALQPQSQFNLQTTITTPEQILGLKELQEAPVVNDGGGGEGSGSYFDELSEEERSNKKTYIMMGGVVFLIVAIFVVLYMLLSGGSDSSETIRNNNLPTNSSVEPDNNIQTENNTTLNNPNLPEVPSVPILSEPEIANAKTPPSPIVDIQGMLTRPYPINNPSLSELRGVFDSIKAQEFPSGSVTYIPIELVGENGDASDGVDKFLSAQLFMDAIGIDAPPQFLDSIEPTFMLYAYSPTEDDRAECERVRLRSSTCPGVRLGLVFVQRASPGVGAISLPNLVSNWISSADITTFKPFILDNVIFPSEVTFKKTSYGDLDYPISYVNLPHHSTAIDFATVGRYLVIGTSKNSVITMVDAIDQQR